MHKCYARYTSIGQLFCESVVLLTADSNAICICTEHIGAQCYDMYNGTLIFKAMVHILSVKVKLVQQQFLRQFEKISIL